MEPRYHPDATEKEIESYWKSGKIYSICRKKREGKKPFFFVDGPPYTTGSIHLGTAWNKIIKDCILRYKSMRGFRVLDRAGWDMHGLPIEVLVESKLGFQTKKDVENYGIDKFVMECKSFALKHKESMTSQFQRLGAWLEWENAYETIAKEYIEAIWWTLKKAYEKGLLEEGLRVVNWCPRCETALAEAEVEYIDTVDPSIYVKFPVGRKKFILIWTTTPWTIPSNVAVAVHREHEYVEVKSGEETFILSSGLADEIFKKAGVGYEIVSRSRGKQLEGMKYSHPLEDEVPHQKKISHLVYSAGWVTLEEGTGCVHIAPAFGEEDFALGKEKNLPVFCPVGHDGRFTSEGGKYEGINVRKANKSVISDLREKNLLFLEEKVSHRYGHCWRCKTPIIFLATEQWFVKISEIKKEMLVEAEKVKWYPEWAGSSRFADWVSQAKDWCISRQRYWGTPLPIWKCECGRREVIGKVEELEKRTGKKIADLHLPHIDEVLLQCECGRKMRRVPDVFDVWFDSAVASWATLNFPESEEGLRYWPADFITEGHDQTRGWFYSQLGASMIAFGVAPYRSVLMHGFTLDEYGRKMSKSLGNVVDPEDVIKKYGADTLRFYILSANAPWDDLRFSWKEAENTFRLLNICWNAYRFAVSYMELDSYSPEKRGSLRIEDRWILSRVQSLVREVTEKMEKYELHSAARALEKFIIQDLSRWYIPLTRKRTWIEYDAEDKTGAYFTLYHSLLQLSKLLAPFIPFLAEKLYNSLPATEESVHLSEWPSPTEWEDPELEKRMGVARKCVEAVLKVRQSAGRKLRWPLKKVAVVSSIDIKDMEGIIKEQSNSKDVVFDRIEGEKVVITNFDYGEIWVDLTLDEEIEAEAYARELIRRIQAMRKELELDMEERIKYGIQMSERIERILEPWISHISKEVRGERREGVSGYIKEWEIDGVKVKIGIERKGI